MKSAPVASAHATSTGVINWYCQWTSITGTLVDVAMFYLEKGGEAQAGLNLLLLS